MHTALQRGTFLWRESHTTLTRRPLPIAAEKKILTFEAVDSKTIPPSAAVATHVVVRRAEAELESVREKKCCAAATNPSAGLWRLQ